MNIVQITPGAGGMFCGNCIRDNALVAELRRLGHSVLMVPLYLPMTLDEADQSAGTPVFFSGVNVYLQQKSALFRQAPDWLHRWMASPRLLKWAGERAGKTKAADVGDLTVSMLRGEDGNQSRELDELVNWLKENHRPDVICLSNAMLIGLARRLKTTLGVPVASTLQGEDYFLDSLPDRWRVAAWETLRERAADVDLFIAPSRYFAELMSKRLALPADRVRVIHNGISADGFAPASATPAPPAVGYFARMCKEKGLDTLVKAFIRLRERARVPGLKLRVAGYCGPSDERFVDGLKAELNTRSLLGEAEFHPNVDRAAKQRFLQTLSVFSVPALYGEAFGLYLLEAWATGLPVVQPRHGAFPELVTATGGGVLCEPGNAGALADAIEALLLDPARARALGEAGRRAVVDRFNTGRLATDTIVAFEACSKHRQ